MNNNLLRELWAEREACAGAYIARPGCPLGDRGPIAETGVVGVAKRLMRSSLG